MTRNIKPAQYIEIGVRNASSDLIIFLADDLKCDNKFLDKMYESYNINRSENDVLICLFMKFNKLWEDEEYKSQSKKKTPRLITIIIPNKIYIKCFLPSSVISNKPIAKEKNTNVK